MQVFTFNDGQTLRVAILLSQFLNRQNSCFNGMAMNPMSLAFLAGYQGQSLEKGQHK